MPGFPVISIRQPQPFDLVDEPVQVAGVGTAFEAPRPLHRAGPEYQRATVGAIQRQVMRRDSWNLSDAVVDQMLIDRLSRGGQMKKPCWAYAVIDILVPLRADGVGRKRGGLIRR